MAKKTLKKTSVSEMAAEQKLSDSTPTQQAAAEKAGLQIKVKLENNADQTPGRLKVVVQLFQDGVLISEDYDWVHA